MVKKAKRREWTAADVRDLRRDLQRKKSTSQQDCKVSKAISWGNSTKSFLLGRIPRFPRIMALFQGTRPTTVETKLNLSAQIANVRRD